MSDEEGRLIWRIRLAPDCAPIPIFVSVPDSDEPVPIEPDWLGVVRWSEKDQERFELAFYTADGGWLEGLQFDTAEIALDQAAEIVGVLPGQWEAVSIPMPEDADGPTWS